MKARKIFSEAGYSLAELLVAMAVGMLVIAAASATYTVQNRSFVAQEDLDEVNAEARVALARLSNDIKSAGFGAPDRNRMAGDLVNGRSAYLTPTDSTSGTDAVTIVSGLVEVGVLSAPVNVTDTVVNIKDYASGSLNYLTGTPPTCSRCYISLDGVNFARVQSCPDTNSDFFCDPGATVALQLDRAITVNLPMDRPVYGVQDISYCVDAAGDMKRILRNADLTNCVGTTGSFTEVVARNIEDLQFAYSLEGATATFVNGDTVSLPLPDARNIAAVRVNVLGRSDKPSKEMEGLGNPPSALENRNHSATNDSFRRRLWRAVTVPRRED